MGRPGRPSPRKEQQIRNAILNAVPAQAPGITFSNLVSLIKRNLGISRPTVWRHLTNFTKMKLVYHEGRFYRRNPLIVDLPANRLARLGIDLNLLSQQPSAMFWEPEKHWISKRIENPDVLFEFFKKTILDVTHGYVTILHAITAMPTLEAAHELADLMVDYQVNWFLMLMARQVWDKRRKVQLRSLAGREISVIDYTGL